MADERLRVVITGMGAMTPLGETPEEYWNNLVSGKSGIGPMSLCDPDGYPCRISGEVSGFDPGTYIGSKEARRMARFTQLAVAAALQAVEAAAYDISKDDPYRVGVVLGNGNGGFPTLEENCRILTERGGMRMSPFFFPMILPNMAAAAVSRYTGAHGYNSTATTACAASNQALGDAMAVIQRGTADVMLAGGTEAGISLLGLSGFSVMRALSTRNDDPQKASRPFDSERDGFIPSEGSVIMVLESLEHALGRGADILAELAGFGSTSDAGHPVQPEENGTSAAEAMQMALNDAGVLLEQVDYINAHGTSTPLNDTLETVAIKRLFGDSAYNIPVSSTKSMIGHSLGAAGSLDAAACVKTITEGMIHPTVNYENPDPTCDLDYVPNQPRAKDVQVALSNAFGFGGQNACLVFRKYVG
ncbi:MAG: beta-ketoacyl-ACP synthase II [Chloroflexota bacterium]|nr:MAG: beta-ketoacyl-[acyl-carrier-protein] synthase II [SAR202 cluster bacterium]MCH2672579.1 beta-ketoacyl-ACP synthase II [Dehalococcoidia bacterium]MEE3014538.1 beta-ketoacyl-ACP synthase II [Chloroflexota bacterium]GIS95606.1 MAG: 3-oxoacyl-[acyl-carrier-protein] synthase 2 [Dehalococcoidia bacterium]